MPEDDDPVLFITDDESLVEWLMKNRRIESARGGHMEITAVFRMEKLETTGQFWSVRGRLIPG